MTLTPSKVNQGAPGPNASPWPISVQSVAAGLALPIVGSAPAQSSATWTSATALNTALTYTGLAPYGAVTIGITTPTTLTAGAVTIETSLDGTNWTQAGSVRVDNSQAENVVPLAYWPGTNGTRQYLVSLDALTQIRVRLSTVITGTGNTTVIIAPAQQGVEPLVTVRPRQVATYGALYRLAAATAGFTALAWTAVANTDKQLATIYHTAASTKTLRLRYASIFISQAGGAFEFEVRRLSATTAPTTGNPAITPGAYDSSDSAAEAACLSLPTTAGSYAAADSPIAGGNVVQMGTFASPTNLLGVAGMELPLYDGRTLAEGKLPTLRAGVAEGFAVVGRNNAAVGLNFKVAMQFTEEAA